MPTNATKPQRCKLDPRSCPPRNARSDFDQKSYDGAWLFRMARVWLFYWRVNCVLAAIGLLASLYLAFVNIWALLLVLALSYGLARARRLERMAWADYMDADVLLQLDRIAIEDEMGKATDSGAPSVLDEV